MASRMRPIHSKIRKLNLTPSPSEPSESDVERQLHLNDDILAADEEYHSKHAGVFSCVRHGSGANAPQKGRKGAFKKFPPSPLVQSPPLHPNDTPLTHNRTGRHVKSDSRKSQSFNDILTLGDNALIENLPQPFVLSQMDKKNFSRGESFPSTVSSVTDDGVWDTRMPKAPGHLRESRQPPVAFSFTEASSPDTGKRHPPARSNSSSSVGRRDAKNEAKKRARARKMREDALSGQTEYGHDDEIKDSSDMESVEGLLTSDEEEETFGDLCGKSPDAVQKALYQTKRCSGKRKLILGDLNLSGKEVPTEAICSRYLGAKLHKLSLAGNNLRAVPDRLTVELTGLRTLDLQQCNLRSLPRKWSLPHLRRLILSHNCLDEFLDENALAGLPDLEYLDMSDNKVCEIILPQGGVLRKLEYLDLDFNYLSQLPDDLPRLTSLKTLKVSNNSLTHIPEHICEMNLTELTVIPNPLIQPPLEDCVRGIHGMRRYYEALTEKQKLRKPAPEKRRIRKKNRQEKRAKKAQSKVLDDDETPLIQETEAVAEEVHTEGTDLKNSIQKQPISAADNRNVDAVEVQTKSEQKEAHENIVNDTLKIIFVGMAYSGKTTIIKRLKEGLYAKIPECEKRTIGIDITEWNPKNDCAVNGIDDSIFDTRVIQEDDDTDDPVDIKFSVWDFAGQNAYHATHEIFFSPHALYVLVWDMGASNDAVRRRNKVVDDDEGPFKLEDSSSEEEEDLFSEKEARRAERALDRDIDEKVQFWVNCIQSCVPGAVILPVASFDDHFDGINGGPEEAKRRCNKMKERLVLHERARVNGLKKRLRKLESGHRANSQAASRLRHLLSPFTRPKLVFDGESEQDTVLRVSGKEYRGFDTLRAKIIHLATGRDLPQGVSYPLFRGHVGSPIPPLRLKIRDFVKQKRGDFKIIEWKHFLSMLEEYMGKGSITSVGHVSDALRFLSNIGELSYFGDCQIVGDRTRGTYEELKYATDVYGISDQASCNGRDKTVKIIGSESKNESLFCRSVKDIQVSRLSQFIFLNPKWLAAAVGCILRHDLKQEIDETLRLIARKEDPTTGWQFVGRGGSRFHEANLHCPIITADEACMLWKAKKMIFKAAERAKLVSISSSEISPFEFLQGLLVHFSVFVPIDLTIDKAVFGGQEYSTTEDLFDPQRPTCFFLPSLLGPGEPGEKTWTYKCNDSWKTCLCHSWLFPDGPPPGLMERITASVLRSLHAVAALNRHSKIWGDASESDVIDFLCVEDDETCQTEGGSGQLRFHEILCWRTAFNVTLGRSFLAEDGALRESRVEVWAHLVEQDSSLCVAGDWTAVGMRRLVISAKGQEGQACKNIWRGGYELVMKAVERVINEYGGLQFEKEGVCPECLGTLDIRQARMWGWTRVEDVLNDRRDKIRCGNGHQIDIRSVAGLRGFSREVSFSDQFSSFNSVPFSDLCGGVVLVGLWDGSLNRIIQAGSGFVVDSKRGLIVTAGHVLINMDAESGSSFGSNYYGLKHGRAVIGVIVARDKRSNKRDMCVGPEAFFRYFADIVAKDCRNMDACVLRITSRMSNYVGGDGAECGVQKTYSLVGKEDIKKEKLQKLRATRRCEYEEEVRILGYNQGGEGLVQAPRLNRVSEVARGSVVKKYKARELYHFKDATQNSFRPKMEIVVSCPTIGGHSGGPCVNRAGEVIGILSRADSLDKQRCYLVPSSEFLKLVKEAIIWEEYE